MTEARVPGQVPGVVRVFTGADLAKVCDPWVAVLAHLKGMKSAKMATKEATIVVTGFTNYIKSVGLIEVALGAAVQSTDASRELFEHIVNDAISLSKGEKPAEDPKEGDKPAEGSDKPAKAPAAPAAPAAEPAKA